jgi:hypothetical protein
MIVDKLPNWLKLGLKLLTLNRQDYCLGFDVFRKMENRQHRQISYQECLAQYHLLKIYLKWQEWSARLFKVQKDR